MVIKKRGGYYDSFDSKKIYNAVLRAFQETNSAKGEVVAAEVAEHISSIVPVTGDYFTVEAVQDLVEDYLIELNFAKEAKAYIKYRHERTRIREAGWQMDDLQKAIWSNKYQFNGESHSDWLQRVSGGNKRTEKIVKQKKFLFAGRILANRGLQHHGKKISFSNCFVLSQPKDNLESIYDVAKEMARTYSYGGK